MLIVKNQNESFSQLENIQYLLILRVINTPAGLYRLIRLINITKETGKHTAHTHTHTETKDQRLLLRIPQAVYIGRPAPSLYLQIRFLVH
jgi:hypothetical protein